MSLGTSSPRNRRHGTSIVAQAWRTLTWLLIALLALIGLNWLAVAFQGGQWTPKLALDLEGGTQVVLAAQLPAGQADPTAEQMQQAVSIIRQRVDAAGVSEAEITTQGGRNIVVAVPGEMDPATRDRIESSARLDFRAVITADSPANSQPVTPEMEAQLLEMEISEPTHPSDPNAVPPEIWLEFIEFNCATDIRQSSEVSPDDYLVTCSDDGTEKYVLGPVEVSGEHITDASAGLTRTSQGATTNTWAVDIRFDAEGTTKFAEVTQRLYGFQVTQSDPNKTRFAVTLDSLVIVAPTTNAAITDGRPQISGSFNEESAKALADQLKFGALPFSFETQSTSTISATLGSSHLINGLIAGGIGLLLVVLYSLFQYRALGLLTVASLAMSASITYLVVTYLSSQEGYRLSLAGVAGLIVAIGITADSFIVYFERIKDELRDGRGLVSAVEAGWSRAFRTILASDAVNLLVSIVLFIIAVGNVRGFALTLGITTIIDVVVVSLFTHPMMRLLARTRFFGDGHSWSGLNPDALGAVYRGRGTFRKPEGQGKRGASREAAKRQTLAERKAAAAAGDEDVDDVKAAKVGPPSTASKAKKKRGSSSDESSTGSTSTALKEAESDDDATKGEDD